MGTLLGYQSFTSLNKNRVKEECRRESNNGTNKKRKEDRTAAMHVPYLRARNVVCVKCFCMRQRQIVCRFAVQRESSALAALLRGLPV